MGNYEHANVFKEYLDKRGESWRDFAKRSNMAFVTIYQIYKGTKPHRSTAVRICRHSKGQLKIGDFGYLRRGQKRQPSEDES